MWCDGASFVCIWKSAPSFLSIIFIGKMHFQFCQFARSGTFACYGDMTVTMDKINSKTNGPIDGKKGDGRLLMIINRILFSFSYSRLIKYLLEATMCSDFQRDSCHCHFAWSGLKLGFAKHHNSQTLFFIYFPWHFLRQIHYSQKKRINHRNFCIGVPTINCWVLKIFLPFFQLLACCFLFSPFKILPEALSTFLTTVLG